MHLVALVKSLDNACCRYRLAAYRPFLETAGHSLGIYPWPNSLMSRYLLGRYLRGADVLILQRKLPNAAHLRLLRKLSRFLIFDFDDAIFRNDSFHPDGPLCPKRIQRFRKVVETADVAVAGNGFLQEQAELWVDADRVQLIPTCIDTNRYSIEKQAGEPSADLVWIGSASTLRGLELVRPLLEELGARQPGLRLKIICDRFLSIRNVEVVRRPWSNATEAQELKDVQIGFSWLPDDDWSRGKCGLKILQYFAAGLPVIANPVGLHRQLVIPSVTGFLVETAEEFASAVQQLRTNRELRQRLGRAGRELVERHFTVEMGAARWMQLLEQLTRTSTTVAPLP
jgi:glycosyltransferase involved in cell wall biosynthesis